MLKSTWMSGSVLAVSSRALVGACTKLGIDSARMLEGLDVTRDELDDPDGRISLDNVRALWARAYQLSGDPDLALHVAEALPIGAYRVIDFLAWNAPTVGGALTQVSKYFPIINSLITLPIRDRGDEFELGIECPSQPAALTRPYVEYTFAAVFLRTREVTGGDLRLERIEFALPAPADLSEHERIFNCSVRFGAQKSQMVLSHQSWHATNQQAASDLFAVLEKHAQMLLGQIPREAPEILEVRKSICAQLRGGDPSLEFVAKGLATSPRTLQRRLKAHGVRYLDLLDTMREGTAKSYLNDSKISITEAAYLLGFSEQSAFTRAFKRWTGSSPNEYRKGGLATGVAAPL